MPASGAHRSVGTLARGLDVLTLFATQRPELTQTEIAELLGLPLPSVHRLTKLLMERGWLVRAEDTRRLSLGLEVARLMPALLAGLRLPDVARERLRVLAQSTGETVNLAVLHGGEVVYLLSESGANLLTLRAPVGLRLPAHATALGKCLLAQLPREAARSAAGPEPYAAVTARTITRWTELERSLDAIGRSGVALSRDEYELGLHSIAVPVTWLDGERSAAVNVSLPGARASPAARRELTAALRACAVAIESAAGLRVPGELKAFGVNAGTLPFWLDDPYEPRPALSGRLEVEACVIGAGVGGLSCACRLAERGVETVVLDRTTVAGGASGRNGGFLLAGVAAFHNDARELYGREHARRLYASTLAAQQEIYELAAQLGAGDSLREVGSLRVAVSEPEEQRVRGQVAALREDGFPCELVEGHELPDVLRRRGRCACLIPHDAALHPARWYRSLAAAAEELGVRIFEDSAVRGPVPAPGEGSLRTEAGSVSAHHVVVAADGALPALVPDYEEKVRARRLHMVASEPIEERLVEQLVYPRWGYEYFQQRPDGRILLGGYSDLDGAASYTDSEEGNPEIWDRLENYLREELGLRTRVSHRWVGIVGYTEDQLPYVGEVPGRPGLYVAGGYSGHGNLPGYVAGEELAKLIAGEPLEPLFGSER